MKEAEFFWLVGLLEGEGSFCRCQPSNNAPRISLHMTDKDVVDRVGKMFARKVLFCKRQKSHHKDSYKVSLSGKKAIDLMLRLRPFMGERRQLQIQSAVDSHDNTAVRRRVELSRRLSDENIKETINAPGSLRKKARALGVCHETLRRAIKRLKVSSSSG